MMTTSRMMIPMMIHIRIFMSFHLQLRSSQRLVKWAVDKTTPGKESPYIPHLLAHSVCAPAEPLCRDCEIVGLVLKRIQSLTTL